MARAPIKHPEAIPVTGTDAHLAALVPAQLSAIALRARLGRPLPPAAIPGDSGARPETLRAAAVLVALVERENGLAVLLTRRTDHLYDHPGQISFPGGRTDEGDRDHIHTALREAEEEVGLARSHIEVIGQLPLYTTVTGYAVTPVVGLVQPGFELRLDTFEVAEAFEVPLAYLMTPAHHRRHEVEFAGERRRFLSMPWHGRGTAGVEREFFIWGATAAMLRNLYHVLGS